jgi:hypothetical protein
MWKRLLFAIFLVGIAYSVLKYFLIDDFTPGKASTVYEPVKLGDHTVSSSGPSSPNSSPQPNMPTVVLPPPEASDPYDMQLENTNAPEQLRFPERSFSPGIIPKETDNHLNAGLSGSLANTPQSIQQYSPEFVGNGGKFFGEVSALEDENPNYSAF